MSSAIWGMSPSMWLRGRRACPVPESGSFVVPQSATLGTVMMRRHLPICTTRGTFLPVGTPVSVNEPSAPVNAKVTKSPIDVSHELQLPCPLPGVIAGSVLTSFGMKTTTLWSGFVPAGS